ncbi:hypothetical protein D5086_021677 [Populus alba]|uniref:Uncharacterized protein n=1 Tax=Populus alba TaxID=43335 RepID=A0ACC4BD77_POPAL
MRPDACYIVFVIAASSTCLLVYCCNMLVLSAIYCWFVLGLHPSGQDPEAFCLVDVVLYCCFMESSLLRFLKLNASFCALFATVLGVVAICSLVCSMSSFLKVAKCLQCCLPTLATLASPYHANVCWSVPMVANSHCCHLLLHSYSIRLLLGSSAIAWVVVWLLELLCFPAMVVVGCPFLQVHYRLWFTAISSPRACLFAGFDGVSPTQGENVGLLLSPCGEADFMLHRGASCYYAHLWARLYFGTFVPILCCSGGYVCLLGLNKLAASD